MAARARARSWSSAQTREASWIRSAVSSDGSWICCSDSETRLYAISIGEICEGNGGAEAPSVARVPLPSPVLSASCCRFTPDSKAMLLGSHVGIIQV